MSFAVVCTWERWDIYRAWGKHGMYTEYSQYHDFEPSTFFNMKFRKLPGNLLHLKVCVMFRMSEVWLYFSYDLINKNQFCVCMFARAADVITHWYLIDRWCELAHNLLPSSIERVHIFMYCVWGLVVCRFVIIELRTEVAYVTETSQYDDVNTEWSLHWFKKLYVSVLTASGSPEVRTVYFSEHLASNPGPETAYSDCFVFLIPSI
jgi:hypothetical protein